MGTTYQCRLSPDQSTNESQVRQAWLGLVYGCLVLFPSAATTDAVETDRRPPPNVNNIWYEYNDSDTVFVFVHGIMSDSRSAWYYEDATSVAENTYWPELIRKDDRLGHPSIFLAGYYTDLDSGDYSIRDAANEVYQSLVVPLEPVDQPLLKKPNILFIAHSTGGIVVRHMLVKHTVDFKDKAVGLLLIASPSVGSRDADRLAWLADFAKQKMGTELQWDHPFLEELDKDFKNLVDQRQIPRLVGAEAIENHFIVKWLWLLNKKVLVEPHSAGRYFGEPIRFPNTNHFSAVKPDGLRHPAYLFLRQFYQMRFSPMKNEFWPEKPAVLFITPEDTGYGKLHEAGLRAALEGSELDIRTCYTLYSKTSDEFGYESVDLARVKTCIEDAMETKQIVALVGPCLMISTNDIVEKVLSLNSNLPIILESPVSRKGLGNSTGGPYSALKPGYPVYRISSGLDERVPHLVEIIKFVIEEGIRVTILVEDTPYGESLSDGVMALLRDDSDFRDDKIKITRVKRTDDLATHDVTFDGMVFYFGSGERYIEIARDGIKKDQNVRFIGVMNAWAIEGLENGDVLDKLIDLEDIVALGRGKHRNKEQLKFEDRFGLIGPAVRDQAFSYDAGLIVANAWSYAVNRNPQGKYLQLMKEFIESNTHEGIVGRITFPKGGGQNANLRVYSALHKAEISDQKLEFVPLTEKQVITALRSEATN